MPPTPTSNLMGPEPEEGEEDQRIAYITGIGPELDPDDFSASDEEIRLWLADNGGSADNDEDVDRAREAIKLDKYYKAIAARMLPEDIASKVYAGADGDKVLLINNTVDSAYRYGSSGYTLSAETAYMITVRVFTYGIGHVDENGVWTAAGRPRRLHRALPRLCGRRRQSPCTSTTSTPKTAGRPTPSWCSLPPMT